MNRRSCALKRTFSFNNRSSNSGRMKHSSRSLSTRSALSSSSFASHNNNTRQKNSSNHNNTPGSAAATATGSSEAFTTATMRGSQRSLGGWVVGGGSIGLGGNGSLDTSFNLHKFEELLCVRIPVHFRKIKSAQFLGLAQTVGNNNSRNNDDGSSSHRHHELLERAIGYLGDALAAPESRHFSLDELVDIHSYLGLIYEQHDDFKTAIDYFMTALWLLHKPFKSGGASLPKGYDLNAQVAICLYRLGNLYGRIGDTERMMEAHDRAEWFREGDIFIAAVRS